MEQTNEPLQLSRWDAYRRLLAYLKPLWFIFVLAIIGNAIYAAASTAMAAAMEYVVEAIENPTPENRLFVPLLVVVVFSIRGLGAFLGSYYMTYVGRQIVHQLRCELFERYLQLPCRFYDTSSSGHLLSKITFNVEQVTGAATHAITIILREGLTVIGMLGFMLYMNWKLTALFLLIGPLIGLTVSYVTKRFRKLSERIQNSMGDVTHVASEAINGYRVVRTFAGEKYEAQRFHQVSENNLRQSIKMAFTHAISTPIIQVLVSVAIAMLVWLALAPEVQGNMTTGEFIAFITAATTMAKPIRQLTQVNAVIQQGVVAAQDVFKVIDEDAEKDTGALTVDRVRGDIEFRNVSFRYEESGEPVLKDLSFSIKQGETIALVGKSGGGKTTLASLIPRFYDSTEGQILVDGKDINDYTLSSLRKQIALVTQNVTLFNDTVKNNVAYGGLQAHSDDAIRDAAEQSHAMEYIDALPDGMDTGIGDNGLMLSGGQRQRLAIARALLKDAPILILDEATSALDTESEAKIQQALEAVMKGRTTIVIAHRLSTIENADRIFVMDKGSIREQGSHEELLAKNGLYASLHKMQFSE